jgi:enterochelin esterase-like enzyme
MDDVVGARWLADGLSFRVPDPERRLAGVRLVAEVAPRRARPEFGYDEVDRGWRLWWPAPDAWRLEYRLELVYPDGGTEVVCDPDNPLRAAGAFGDRSVLLRADYTEPAWLHAPTAEGSWRELSIAAPPLGADVWARIWSPAAPTEEILLVHDGPEYDKLGDLGQFSAAMIGAGRVPAHHLVLLAPGPRDEWYSANPAYTRALGGPVLARLRTELGSTRPVVGLGISLGGLALLHAQRHRPAAFAGLFLQSSSFFRRRLDRQESRYRWYVRIVRFTDRVVAASATARAVPVGLTCGRAEENLANNRELAATLSRQGHPVQLHEVPDAHNFTAWRDALDPHLTDLLRRVWSPGTGEG